MKNFSQFIQLLLLFGTYYTVVSFFLVDASYLNLEHLFLTNQLYSLFEKNVNTLEIFYFSSPLLHQIAAMPFGFFDAFIAPVITSLLAISILGAFVVNALLKSKQKVFAVLGGVYFLVSPVMIYAAVSGSSLYLHIILLFIIFYFFLRFVFDNTTFNLILVSLAISLFIFLDYRFLYFVLFLIPLFFLYSIYLTIGVRRSFIKTIDVIIESFSQERKLISRFFSILTIVVFTPLVTFGLYLIINKWFGGEYFYFTSSNVAHWNKFKFLNFQYYNLDTQLINTSFSYLVTLKNTLLLSPLFLGLFYLIKKRLLLVYILLLVPVFIIFSQSILSVNMVDLKTFSVLIASAIGGLILIYNYSHSKMNSSNKITAIVLIIFSLQVLGEWVYFKETNDFSEADFANAILQHNKKIPWLDAQLDMAGYIQENLDPNETILTDSSIFYPSLSFFRKEFNVKDRYSNNYYKYLLKPKADSYLLISNPTTFYYNNDDLRHFLFPDFDNTSNLITIHHNSYFTLYKIKAEESFNR